MLPPEKVKVLNKYFKERAEWKAYAKDNFRHLEGIQCEWCKRFKKAGFYRCVNCGSKLREYEDE